MREVDCYFCEGSGFLEYQDCDQPASMCCGGCYTTNECDECNGTGKKFEIDWDCQDD